MRNALSVRSLRRIFNDDVPNMFNWTTIENNSTIIKTANEKVGGRGAVDFHMCWTHYANGLHRANTDSSPLPVAIPNPEGACGERPSRCRPWNPFILQAENNGKLHGYKKLTKHIQVSWHNPIDTHDLSCSKPLPFMWSFARNAKHDWTISEQKQVMQSIIWMNCKYWKNKWPMNVQ